MSEKSAVDFINTLFPDHCRTSCSDENLYNAAYGPDDHEGTGRCKRCNLLDIVRRTLEPVAQEVKS